MSQQPKDRNKVYSLHDPAVYCVGKGKDHKAYEYGRKASVVATKESQVIVGVVSHDEHDHDSKTLKAALTEAHTHRETSIRLAVVDRGYRGAKNKVDCEVLLPGPPLKRDNAYQRQKKRILCRKRSAIEPIIGHLKHDHRLLRSWLKGAEGDRINLLMAGCAWNLRKLYLAGVDVFRLNFSHGSHEDHRDRVEIIRRIEKEIGHPIGILMDIQGPKLRLGTFRHHSVELAKGDTYRLDLDASPGDDHRAPLLHPEIFAALTVGSELMIDDGRVKLEVTESSDQHLVAKVLVGGSISDNKGVNIPGVVLPISVITEKDRIDLQYGLSLGVDWVAQSFVQQPDDVRELRSLVKGRAAIMVKMEKPSALENLDEILELCDGMMVARGDLGVELPPEKVPIVQKRLIRQCRQAGKPVVIATHMLDSMVHVPVPTRAEASDVATAIYDGADAVMLSAESAAGDYPVRSVTIMNKIIFEVEQDPLAQNILDAQRPDPNATTADAICNALQKVTHVLSSTATVTYTSSGSTALRAARERPRAPILSLTPEIGIARYLCVAWGVHPVLIDVASQGADLMEVINAAKDIAVKENFAKSGDAVIIAAGLPFGISGTTNLLHIAWVD